MNELDAAYWQNRYENEKTGWDIGYISTPLKFYFDNLTDKSISILIPGGGNAYEIEYLFNKGFKNVYLLDWAEQAIENFKQRNPNFPESQLIIADFFEHNHQYDLIIEQTFFCALNPYLRKNYLKKMFELLKPKGKLVGLLFNKTFEKKGPPFGGTKSEYEALFSSKFDIEVLEDCRNSIPPRAGNELFFIFWKK